MSAAKSSSSGRQLYVGETTVTKAIQAAGGLHRFCQPHKIKLIRATGQIIKVITTRRCKIRPRIPPVYPNDQINVSQKDLVMIQLNILSGKKAGSQTVARHFPFRIGRAAQNELPLDETASGTRILTWNFNATSKASILRLAANALATVNGESVAKRNPPQRRHHHGLAR